MTPFELELARWHDFNLLLGGAAATLMGLLFVSLSFGVGRDFKRQSDGIHAFVTPTLVHFVDALVIAAAAVAPITRPSVLGWVLLAAVAANLPQGWRRLHLIHSFHREDPFDWRDWLWFVLLPLCCQVLLLAAAAGLLTNDLRALYAVGASLVLTLVVGVRNAWDLVVWMLLQRKVDSA